MLLAAADELSLLSKPWSNTKTRGVAKCVDKSVGPGPGKHAVTRAYWGIVAGSESTIKSWLGDCASKNKPTPRIWTRFLGVSGCRGFLMCRKNIDGRSKRMRLTPNKPSRTIARMIGNKE